jgi:uncharacterized membrane protein
MSNPEKEKEKERGQHRRMEHVLSDTLLYGVLASTGVIILGLIMLTATGSTGYACDISGDALSCILSFKLSYAPSQLYPNTLAAVASGLILVKPFAIIQLGVIILLATPLFRVGSSLFLFAFEKDRAFVLITLFVLGVLLFSFFIVPMIPIFKA